MKTHTSVVVLNMHVLYLLFAWDFVQGLVSGLSLCLNAQMKAQELKI